MWPGSIVFRQQRSKGYFLSSPFVYTHGFGVFDHPNIKSSHTFFGDFIFGLSKTRSQLRKCAMYTIHLNENDMVCPRRSQKRKKEKEKKRGVSTLVPDTYYNKPCL